MPPEADFYGEQSFPTANEGFFDELPPGENYETVPGYGDEDVPYPGEDLSAYEPKRSRRGTVAIATLLVVAIIGGAAVVMLRSGGTNGIPPIITADTSPTKVTPDSTGSAEGDSQAKLIYDRVDPGTEVANSKLVVTDENPVADIPPTSDASTSEVSRVILEGGPGFDSGEDSDPTAPMDLTNGGRTTIASGGTDSEPIGPKKVRTVVVRPDGTIVSSEATPSAGEATSSGEAQKEMIAELPPASETPPAPAAEDNPLLSDDFGVEAIDNPTPEDQGSDKPIANPSSASVPDIPPRAPASAPTPRTAPASSPTIVATTGDTSGPIDVTPSSSSKSPSTTGSGGGFLVQVSSQRSEEVALATFHELQRRYPSIFGDRQPNIQRADLGERGVYYRVRVGYSTRDEAVRMCENLKAAGGDCLLASR